MVVNTVCNDRVVGIDEHVVRLESVEMKAKLNHFEGGVAKQAMAETEAGAGYVRRDRLFGAQRQETAAAFPFFDHTQGEAGRIGCEELAHKLPVDGQSGQQRINLPHELYSPLAHCMRCATAVLLK